MKLLGIVGGLGHESTIDSYRLIIDEYRRRISEDAYPHLVINSLDVRRGLRYLDAGEDENLVDYLAGAVEQLARAGAGFALMAANTPHVVFDRVAARSPIPLLSIVEATLDAAVRENRTRLGLFGTRFTMSGGFYDKVFASSGVALFTPSGEEQDYIHGKYMNELLRGVFLPETRDGIGAIISEMISRHELDGIVLAGTELPLLLREVAIDVPMLDTTIIHVRAAVDQIMA
jgi:aspartate racemase